MTRIVADTKNRNGMSSMEDNKNVIKRMIPFSPPDVGEKELEEIASAIFSGWITTGPRVKRFEQMLENYCQTGSAITRENNDVIHNLVCLSSATAALELNLRVLGVGPGDEVLVPAYTYTATVSPVIHCGAKPILIDIQKGGDAVTHCPEMDYDALELAITERTKAIIAVDLGGLVCDYERIFAAVEDKRYLFRPKKSDGTLLGDLSTKIQEGLGCVAVLGDCAHALGAQQLVKRTGSGELEVPAWRKAGKIAHFSSFSFHAVKNLTTAEGGASTWSLPDSVYDQGVTDEELYQMYQMLSLHGHSRDALAKQELGSWEYDIIGPWYKCNMTDLSAAMGLAQLERYEEMLERRREIIRCYDECCDELGIDHLVHQTDTMCSSGHLYLIRIPGWEEQERNQAINALAELGITANVHYKPLPMLTAYKALGWNIKDFPNSFDYYKNLISLPLYSKLSREDVAYVCQALKQVVGKH